VTITGTIRVAAVAIATIATSVAVAWADNQTVDDPPDDGPGPEGEILQAKAGHAGGDMLKHSVTIEGTFPSLEDAGYIKVDINEKNRGDPEVTLSTYFGTVNGVEASLKNDDHTIVFKVPTKKVKKGGDFGKRYFWNSAACCYPNFSTDFAPDTDDGHGGTSAPAWKGHAFKP
jgi:hypothetical protein